MRRRNIRRETLTRTDLLLRWGRLRAARGKPEAGLALLDKLDRSLRRRAKK
jgi:hypothetical protein